MPLDGTEFGSSESNLLSKLGAVERLLISEQQWCKGRLRDKDGRLCLAGAMQAVEAPQLLNSIILRAAKDVSGKRYWRIESFNDKPDTTHEDVLRVLRRARETSSPALSKVTPAAGLSDGLTPCAIFARGANLRFPRRYNPPRTGPSLPCMGQLHPLSGRRMISPR